jgi:hypothetical protein
MMTLIKATRQPWHRLERFYSIGDLNIGQPCQLLVRGYDEASDPSIGALAGNSGRCPEI